MKFIKLIIVLLIQVTCFGQSATISATLPLVAYIKLSPDNSAFSLIVGTPSIAGGATILPTNTSKWINFTSAVAPSMTRTITAQITSGSVPSGMALKLTISYANGGAGSLGSNVSSINLSTSSQVIISNIGGAYTGQGSGYGYNLSYELVVTDYSQLRAGNTNIGITFTIN
jgi:hypothetical protein